MTLRIGRRVDPATGRVGLEEVVLDSQELMTHGVVLGMTGSGKTGLCIALLEELILAGVPLLILDPKGDLTNLALQFPELEGSQFEPWIDPSAASREGLDSAAYAKALATRWRQGLEEWGMSSERHQQLRSRMDLKIYTPGSESGIPVNVLGSFRAPTPAVRSDAAARAEWIQATVSGLLSLVEVEADPVRSPEHIVLSQILDAAWQQGEDVGLELLVSRLVDPPFKKVGVFPVDMFFPPDSRVKLAMLLNGVLASPAFAAWRKGEELDPGRLTDACRGTPVRLFYLAHLSEPERMFFVSLFLDRVLAWSRTLPGSSELRALVYFDEVAGYLPPHPRQPPSKKPIMTLMKQSRAVGVGALLATQNPVDVDYKALSNAGTWLIGRLQTQQDRERVLDGLMAASGGMDRSAVTALFQALRQRVFLLKRASEDQPSLFHTRWAMSYLRGPVTRSELEQLVPANRRALGTAGTSARDGLDGGSSRAGLEGSTDASMDPGAPGARARTSLPAAPPAVSEPGLPAHPSPTPAGFATAFLDPKAVFSARMEELFTPFAEPRRQDGRCKYRPALHAEIQLRFEQSRSGFLLDERQHRLFFPLSAGLAGASFEVPLEANDLLPQPSADGIFEPLPESLDETPELRAAQEALLDEVYRTVTRGQWTLPRLKLYGKTGESREDFERRCRDAIQDRIDTEIARRRDRYDKASARLEKKIAQQRDKIEKLQTTLSGRQAEQMVNAGELIMGFFTGRKRSLMTAVTRHRTTSESRQRVEQAEGELEQLERELVDLVGQLESELESIESQELSALKDLREEAVRLRRSDVKLVRFGVLFIPVSRRI